jgi:predicted DNA-binding mobile mystery protein A
MLDRRRKTARRALDSRLAPFRTSDALAVPPRGWVRAIRDALGMTTEQLARRMGVRAQSVSDLERSERLGTVQLKTLKRAAEALDCRLVYALVPNEGLDSRVERRAAEIAARTLARVGHTMALEDQAVAPKEQQAELDAFVEANLRERDLW